MKAPRKKAKPSDADTADSSKKKNCKPKLSVVVKDSEEPIVVWVKNGSRDDFGNERMNKGGRKQKLQHKSWAKLQCTSRKKQKDD